MKAKEIEQHIVNDTFQELQIWRWLLKPRGQSKVKQKCAYLRLHEFFNSCVALAYYGNLFLEKLVRASFPHLSKNYRLQAVVGAYASTCLIELATFSMCTCVQEALGSAEKNVDGNSKPKSWLSQPQHQE